MKNFYMAVTVHIDSLFTECPGGDYAYMVKFNSTDNLKSVLEKIGGLKIATMCATKKEAKEMAERCNEVYKKNGTYAFNYPKF